MSILTKIVPSPDWFIGMDSVDLCSPGAFVESLTVEVRDFITIIRPTKKIKNPEGTNLYLLFIKSCY